MTLTILKTIDELRNYIRVIRQADKTIGFVPTMGALHQGHLTLAMRALSECDVCITSIFVNPKQFAPHEDFALYPRTVDADAVLLNQVGVQAVFVPSVETVYPSDFQTNVCVLDISKPLEGEFRPHFFTGVATVVTRLLLLVLADRAYFGEKDFQQLQVIRQMVRDLAIPTDIRGVEIVRDNEGLALSSRNAYLSEDEMRVAVQLNKVLASMRTQLHQSLDLCDCTEFERAVNFIEAKSHQDLIKAGFNKIDYCTVRESNTLLPLALKTKNAAYSHTQLRILAAAWIGKTRLIDNM